MDAEAQERGEPEDATMVHHFRLGAYLGVDTCVFSFRFMPSIPSLTLRPQFIWDQ